MENAGIRYKGQFAPLNPPYPQVHKNIRWLAIAVFFITTLPMARIDAGPVPFYFVDGLVAVSLLMALQHSKVRWQGISRRITLTAGIFFGFVCLSEIRGMLSYQFITPAIYMIFRYGLGVALILIIPRIVNTQRDFQTILKTAVVGMLVTGSLTILSSLPQTRPFVAETVFSHEILYSLGNKHLYKASIFRGGFDYAIRGSSLAGSVNITGGFLCALWPIAFLAYRKFKYEKKWRQISFLACIITPFGALLTYSRTAWLGIALVAFLIGILGYTGRRRIIIIAAALGLLIVNNVGLHSRYFFYDRIERSMERTLAEPFKDKASYERFLSYTQPFQHLLENPIWFIAGAGSAGRKMAIRGILDHLFYGEGDLATHSAFSMAYFNFGFLGAISHVLLMVFAFALILRNIRHSRSSEPEERLPWHALMAVWLGLIPWWLFGHGATSLPRGSMFFFLIFSIMLTCEKLRMNSEFFS